MKILVIDDELYMRKIMEQALKTSGYEVELATDAFEAKDFFNEGRKYSLVICDLVMPGMTGIELIEYVKKKHSNLGIKFIIISARNLKESEKINIESELAATFKKPFDFRKVLLEIEKNIKKDL